MFETTRKVTALLLITGLLAGSAAAVFSINLAEEPRDYSTVSPGADSIQLVMVEDGDGNAVNESRLEENSITIRFDDNGTWQEMDYLKEGYYYAEIENAADTEVVYELQDASPTVPGTVNATEHLNEGNLDLDLETNLSEDLEAGEEVYMEATVQDLGEYYAVDTDESGDVSNGDTFIRDSGGDGTYSARADGIIAGERVEDVSASTSNPWSSIENPVSFSDGTSGDNWDSSSDMIVIDMNGGGTVSVEPDEPLNTGDDLEVDAEVGESYQQLSNIRGEVHVVSADTSLDSGEVTVFDNDSDGVYTAEADMHVAGVEPSEGTDITHQNMVPSTMGISSYDSSSGNSWNGDRDALVIDNDDDDSYTSSADLVLAGSNPSPGAILETNDVGAWNDGNAMVATQGDVEVIDRTLDDAWDPNEDAIWLESGDTNGFQPDEDTVLAGSPSTGDTPTQVSGLFNQWELISAYRADTDDTFDMNEDAIIRESNGGGTFSTEADEVVAGSTSMPSGASFAVNNGIPGDWSLDTIDISSGGEWDSSRDSIVIDRNDGGTYSTTADTVINSGSGSADAGTNLVQLSSMGGEDLGWIDVNGDGSYSTGDEIFRDLDEDGIYTSGADQNIAGLDVDTAGAGTDLTTNNPWSGVEEVLMFYNGSGTGWDSSGDFIAQDLDKDGAYTSVADIVVDSGDETPENGAELMDVSGRNLTFPDVTVTFTDGNMTTGIKELGINPDGTYSNTVEIPDLPDSTIIAQLHANAPKADIEGSLSRKINTREQGIGFTADSDLEMEVDRAGVYHGNVTLENLLESENRIHAEAEDGLGEFAEMDSDIVLEPGESENFTVEINATPAEDYSGEIVFTENATGKTDETEVSVSGPDCPFKTDRLCAYESLINVTAEEREEQYRTITIDSLWIEDQAIDVSTTINGGVNEYASLESTSFTLTDTEELNLTFNPEIPGTYEGELLISSGGGTIAFELVFNADVKELERGLSLSPTSVNLGTVPEGNDASKSFNIENTGTLRIENINLSSDYSIQDEATESLEPGGSQEFSVTFQGIDQQAGQMTVTGEAETGEVSQTAEISATIVQPVSKIKEELRSRISDKRTRATSTSTLEDLTDVESRISSIDTEWNQGNYEEAQRIYQNSLSDLQDIEIQQTGNETDPGTGPQNPGPTDPGNTDEGGGGLGLIIVFAVILLLILLAGFVVYTSYYPEEGDPLYDVLGER
jgi:hypothetical protein